MLFRGVGMSVGDSELLLPVLRAASTAYSGVPLANARPDVIAGKNHLVLVAALQARNNARVTVSGSLELFSNEYAWPFGGGACEGTGLTDVCVCVRVVACIGCLRRARTAARPRATPISRWILPLGPSARAVCCAPPTFATTAYVGSGVWARALLRPFGTDAASAVCVCL